MKTLKTAEYYSRGIKLKDGSVYCIPIPHESATADPLSGTDKIILELADRVDDLEQKLKEDRQSITNKIEAIRKDWIGEDQTKVYACDYILMQLKEPNSPEGGSE